MKIILIEIAVIVFLTNCQTTYDVKVKQSNYKVVKVDLKNEKCNMQQINFQRQKEGVFIEKNDFTNLTNNINNFKICYNNLLEKTKNNLSFYEDVIKTLGGEFEE